MKEILYLGIPYTWNPDKSFRIANEVAAELIKQGFVVFSPISHSHTIADYMDESLRTSQEVWMAQDIPFTKVCGTLAVIRIHGEEKDAYTLIQESKGLQMEIESFKEQKKEIMYIDYGK